MSAGFVPGLSLSNDYYQEAVSPAVQRVIGIRAHSAALIGDGSEVLGFDSARSTDHDWGPRVLVFLSGEDLASCGDSLGRGLASMLPASFRGHSTHFHRGGDGGPVGPYRMGELIAGVEIWEPADWATRFLGFDPRAGLSPVDWMTLPWNLLRGATAGRIFHDGTGEIRPLVKAVSWYPDDVWRHVVACQWGRIAQEEPFAARAAEGESELGSRLISSRQAIEIGRLAYILERQYPPYMKWFDAGLQQLSCADRLLPALLEIGSADSWQRREDALASAWQTIGDVHNASGITAPIDAGLRSFHTRPYRVLGADRFVAATRDSITDPSIRELPAWGCISQCVDSTDVLSSGSSCQRFRSVFT